MATGIIQQAAWTKIWQGNNSVRKGIRHLFWSIIRFFLSGWLWTTAVRLVPMPEPYKNVGIISVVISLLFFIWGLHGLGLTLHDSGLRGPCIFFGSCFLILFIFNLLTFPEPAPIQERLLPTLTKSGVQSWRLILNIGNKLVNAPENFRFAYTGSNAGDYISGFPIPDLSNNPLIVEALPAKSDSLRKLEPGSYAYINTQNGDYLDCRSEASSASPISVRFPSNIRLLILEGPKNDQEENSTWLKLHGPQGEGWCNERFLLPSQ